MKRILLIEDDLELVGLLKKSLRSSVVQVESVYTGAKGLALARSTNFDIVIAADFLCDNLVGEFCPLLHTILPAALIIVLTASHTVAHRIEYVERGADDCFSLPLRIDEFAAYIKALFRRNEKLKQMLVDPRKANLLTIGGLAIDRRERKVTVAGKNVDLSPTEFELLFHLAANPGKVFNREELLNVVWGEGFDGFQHTVNSHINRLRTKVEPDPAHPRFICTSWGAGYYFADASDQVRPPSR